MTHLRLAGIASIAVLSGCADFNAPLNGGSVDVGEQRLQVLEGKVVDLGRRVENLNLAALAQDNTRLAGEIRNLRGEVERLTYLSEKGGSQSKELYSDLDKRLQVLETQNRSTKLALDKTLSAAPVSAATDDEQKAYLSAFELLKASKTDDAIAGFKSLLNRWPQGPYSDNAWYWLGECHYIKRDYDSALQAYEALRQGFPQSPKAADGLFKMGLVYQQTDRKERAIETLQQVLKLYPNTSAASLAQTRLDQLGKQP